MFSTADMAPPGVHARGVGVTDSARRAGRERTLFVIAVAHGFARPLDSATVTAAQKDPALAWWADGELAVAGRLDALTDDELAAPSALPDWSRARRRPPGPQRRRAGQPAHLGADRRRDADAPPRGAQRRHRDDGGSAAGGAARRLRGGLRPARRRDRDDARLRVDGARAQRAGQGDPGDRRAVDARQGGVGARRRPPRPGSPSPTCPPTSAPRSSTRSSPCS